jgi:hypothetical protein
MSATAHYYDESPQIRSFSCELFVLQEAEDQPYFVGTIRNYFIASDASDSHVSPIPLRWTVDIFLTE